jgi:hypothetical protein
MARPRACPVLAVLAVASATVGAATYVRAAAADPVPPRPVNVVVNPGGARLIVDDMVREWFGETLWLLPGRHRVRIDVPDSRCCELVDEAMEVAPADGGPQRFVFHLEMRPAAVVVLQGPDDGTMHCRDLALTAANGSIAAVPMTQPEWSGRCTFRRGAVTVAAGPVRIAAGEVNAILWPED